MKRIISGLICLMLIMSVIAVSSGAEANQSELVHYVSGSEIIQYKLLVSIPYGKDEASLYSPDVLEDQIKPCPMSFAVADDRSVYIIDSDCSNIKHYSSAGKFIDRITLPKDIIAYDIEVTSNEIYIMDVNREVFCNDLIGLENWTSLGVKSTEIEAIGLVEQDNIVYLRTWRGNDLKLSSSLGASTSKVNKTNVDNVISLSGLDTTVSVSYVAQPIGTFIIKTDKSYAYVMEQEALLDYYPYAESRIGKYVDGEKVATALPISTTEYNHSLPFKKLYIVDSGVVYQMVPEQDCVNIYIVPWQDGAWTRITPEMILKNGDPKSICAEELPEENQSEAILSLTPSAAYDRAYYMAYKTWYYNASYMHTPDDAQRTPPKQTGTVSKWLVGLPYCWRGMNGYDNDDFVSSSYSYTYEFLYALEHGQTAGNTYASNFLTTVCGVDCSGFIDVAYKIPTKQGTTGLLDYFYTTTWNSAVKGDIGLNPGSHVFMIKYKYTSGGEIYMISTLESINGSQYSKEGAQLLYRNMSDIVNVFTPKKRN